MEKKLQEWFHHPAVQGGIAPFIMALVTAELLRRMRLSSLAIIAGFSMAVYLAGDFSISPLTAVRKIVWLGLISALVGQVFGLFFRQAGWPILVLAGACASIWVNWRVLQQQELGSAMQWGIAGAIYTGWLIYWMDELHGDSVRASSAGLALGLGTGGAILLGGSALLGQLNLGLAASVCAYFAIQVISSNRLPCDRSLTLPLSLITGLSGSFAAITTQLPWYGLLPLAVIPLAARIPISRNQVLWVQSVLLSVVVLTCAAGSLYLTWRIAGAPPF